MNSRDIEKIKNRLSYLYDDTFTESYFDHLIKTVQTFQKSKSIKATKWSEKDVILITYGDSILQANQKPLVTLNNFLNANLQDTISYVHILPFSPYSSDDGFSVIDYLQVDPNLGDWQDIKTLTKNFNLMFDLVINHISQDSQWFHNYLKGKSPGTDYFIEADVNADLSDVVRPRSLPLLTKFDTVDGEKHLWTTFSSDQIDLNYANPELLLEMINVFLTYIQNGARIIRLDAVAFLWKEVGTNCVHHRKTHEIVKLLRDIAEIIDPNIIILTETNVPNKENLSYFGEGDEAHMVYQFSLPPLLLHALFTGNASYLTDWASKIETPNANCTFFNFSASHDGIGMRPLEGLLPQLEISNLAEGMKNNGGLVNTRRNQDGSDSIYELNITYFDALKQTAQGADIYQVDRFICSQTIMMSLQGIPAFYLHSLLATPNYDEGVKKSGMNRSINRRKWHLDELTKLLNTETSNAQVFRELKRRIKIRTEHSAFHPNAKQQIIDCGDSFFGVKRTSENSKSILSISNVTNKKQQFKNNEVTLSSSHDLITNSNISSSNLFLNPYQTMWLVN